MRELNQIKIIVQIVAVNRAYCGLVETGTNINEFDPSFVSNQVNYFKFCIRTVRKILLLIEVSEMADCYLSIQIVHPSKTRHDASFESRCCLEFF